MVVELMDASNIELVNEFKKDFFIPYSHFVLHFRIDSIETLKSVCNRLIHGHQKGIQIAFNNFANLTIDELITLANDLVIIESIFAYNSKFESHVTSSKCSIYHTKQASLTSNHCGVVGREYFNFSLAHFTESQQHNTCLNRKISIDVNGDIKNCPSMAKSYGNIRDTTLSQAIEKPGFKDVWYIHKDQISVCKDCEFRHICTDCRAYIENPEDQYSKPLKCGYNPYTCEWEEWSTNPLKQAAIDYYGMRGLLKEEGVS